MGGSRVPLRSFFTTAFSQTDFFFADKRVHLKSQGSQEFCQSLKKGERSDLKKIGMILTGGVTLAADMALFALGEVCGIPGVPVLAAQPLDISFDENVIHFHEGA